MIRRLSHPARYAARLGVLALAAALLSGCESMSMNSAQLRVIDASPDSGAIDAYQNSSGLAYSLLFGTMTSYVPMTPGSYTLAAEKGGTHQSLATTTTTLVPGHQYTQLVGNIAANLQQTVLLDQSVPAPAGQIEIRLLQEATRAGAVDVYLAPKNGHPALLGSNLTFGANSGYLAAPAGTYALTVVPAGTALLSSTVTFLSGAQVDYDSGAVRTVVLIDQEAAGLHAVSQIPGVHAIVADDADAQ
jgi:hypothetical protein